MTTDTLGSPRVITDQVGNVTARRDFMPFGEEIANLGSRTAAIGYQADATRQKFTGYERDAESDLDFAQARMYSSKLGRFQSPDDFKNDSDGNDPKTWNLYVYVRNSPMNLTDLTGKFADIYDRKTGEYLGNDGVDDHRVIVGDAESSWEENGKIITHVVNARVLPVTDVEFQERAATTYAESSAFRSGITEDLANEMMAIAYVNTRNSVAYGSKNEQADLFRKTSLSNRKGKMQLANFAVINSLTGGDDPSNGATNWDGAEQSLFPDSDKRASVPNPRNPRQTWELHKNTIGWSISDEHYATWKANVGSGFKAPQVSIASSGANKGKIGFYSTAVYGRTIFWRKQR